MTPELVSKLPQVGTTVFTVMSALAAEHQAVNLGQGFPDFDCDPALLGAVAAIAMAITGCSMIPSSYLARVPTTGPITINITDGGIRIPKVPPAVIAPADMRVS